MDKDDQLYLMLGEIRSDIKYLRGEHEERVELHRKVTERISKLEGREARMAGAFGVIALVAGAFASKVVHWITGTGA